MIAFEVRRFPDGPSGPFQILTIYLRGARPPRVSLRRYPAINHHSEVSINHGP